MLGDLHSEDVKAAIRKRYGTVRQFEREMGLPDKSVTEIFRGRGSRRVIRAVEELLSIEPSLSKPTGGRNSRVRKITHRLNRQAA